jgi:hypothetical protein
LISTTPTGLLARSLPPNFRRSIHILVIGAHDPVTIPDVLEAFCSSQVSNAVAQVDLWVVKRKKGRRTHIEEQRTMFNQVHYAPVAEEHSLAPVACHAVTSLKKPDCPAHVGQMVGSPFKVDFKFAHFENYDKMNQTGTWSYPVARRLLPSDVVILPIRSNYAVKSTETASLWELQVRSCANGARMIVHFYQLSAPVAMMDSKGKQVLILDIKNAFQNTIEFDPMKRTHSTMPPFFGEYIRLRWNTHPDLPAIEEAPSSFVVKNLCSMQGQKDSGQKIYQLMH